MNEPDDRLSHLLAIWRDIDPRATFEADVLRRIRVATPEPHPAARLFSAPAWIYALAALAGILLGAYAGRGPFIDEHAALLKTDTLTGRYVAMISGGAR